MINVDYHPNQFFRDYGNVIADTVGHLRLEQEDAEETKEIERLKAKQRDEERRAREGEAEQETKQ